MIPIASREALNLFAHVAPALLWVAHDTTDSRWEQQGGGKEESFIR
jgi:hypothetical protein